MSKQYSVWATEEARQAGEVASVIASLPISFIPAGRESEIRAIAGHPGWVGQALTALGDGVNGLVIIRPSAEDVTQLEIAAEVARVPVVIDSRWAANPALTGIGESVRGALGKGLLLDSVALTASGTKLTDFLAEHLAAALRFAGQELYDLRKVHQNRHGYTVSGSLANGAPVALHGIITDARPAGVSISLRTTSGAMRTMVPDPQGAWPAEVRVVTAAGETLLPTIYESAHRATWRRLKGHLERQSSAPDLADFARLNATLMNLFVAVQNPTSTTNSTQPGLEKDQS